MNTAYLAQGIRIDVPSLDAARVLGDEIRHAENLARAQAGDVAAARTIVLALLNMPQIDFTPRVSAAILSVLTGRIERASWSHFAGMEDVIASLDAAHGGLAAITLEN